MLGSATEKFQVRHPWPSRTVTLFLGRPARTTKHLHNRRSTFFDSHWDYSFGCRAPPMYSAKRWAQRSIARVFTLSGWTEVDDCGRSWNFTLAASSSKNTRSCMILSVCTLGGRDMAASKYWKNKTPSHEAKAVPRTSMIRTRGWSIFLLVFRKTNFRNLWKVKPARLEL